MDSDIDSYEILNQLATGGQGVTSRARRKADNALVVLKESFCDSSKAGNSALQEAKTLQSLKHPQVIRYEDVFLSEKKGSLVVCTVMEYCDGGDLARYMIALKKHSMPIPPKRVVGWARQLASAVAYLHGNRVLHRDMKPQNVFMATEDSLRVGDFGLAQTMERGKRTSQVGTPCYMAPEVLQHDAYAESVDVWGVGCIVLEAMSLEFLWERRGMLAAHVMSDPILPRKLPADFPAFLREATAACLAATPQRRPPAATLCQMLSGSADGSEQGMGGLGQLLENIQSSASDALTSLFNPQNQHHHHQKLADYAPPAEPHERALLSQTGRSITASVAHSHAPPSKAAAPLPAPSKRLQALPEAGASLLGAAPSAASFRTAHAPSNPAMSTAPSNPYLPASLSAPKQPPASLPASNPHPTAARPQSAATRPSLSPKHHNGAVSMPPVPGGGGEGSNVALLSQLTKRMAKVAEDMAGEPTPPSSWEPSPAPPSPSSAAHKASPQPHHQPSPSQPRAPAPAEDGSMPEAPEANKSPKAGGGGLDGGGEEAMEASGGPRAGGGEIPTAVVEAYLEGGLFAVEPQWRGVVQRAVQRRQVESMQDTLHTVEVSEGKKGGKKSEGGVWSTLSKSLSFGSKSGTGKPGPGPLAAPGEKRWGKKVLVEKANKQYELLYELAEWEQAREATAKVTAVNAAGQFKKEYAADDAIEAEYKRRFGPPKSRFIGSSEKLMVV